MRKYALYLNEEKRIMSATYEEYAVKGMPIVEELPKGNLFDYLYKNKEYIYSPVIPTEEELHQQYEQKSQELIAIKYPPNEENKVIREYLAYPNDETKKKAFNDYNSHVEECKLNARTEIYKQKQA